MRVCIVGGGGFLGSKLAAHLQSQGAHTVLLDVYFQDLSYASLDENQTTRIAGSILDEESVLKALRGCVSCFHLAAYGMSGLESNVRTTDGLHEAVLTYWRALTPEVRERYMTVLISLSQSTVSYDINQLYRCKG